MSERTDLLVIGAGPYAYSAAAYARDNGIETRIVGHPMAFWREQMPTDMYLRSGPDWHLDGSGEATFEAFFEDQGLLPADFDPIPIEVFLDYTEWFRERKALDVEERLVHGLTKTNGNFRGVVSRRVSDRGREGAGGAGDRALPEPARVVRRRARGSSVAHGRTGLVRRARTAPGSRSSAAARAPTNGRPSCATTVLSGWTSYTVIRLQLSLR